MSQQNLSPKEQKIYSESVTLFENLLDDLNSQKLLRKGTSFQDRQKLAKIWNNSRQVGIAFNTIFALFDSTQKVHSFVKNNANEGITHDVLTYTFVSQLLGAVLVNYEAVFKTSLLFFLKEDAGFNRRMTLGQMLRVLKGLSAYGKPVEDKIDFRLRNSLAHGTFWFGKGTIFLAENSFLENVQSMSLGDFFIKVKNQNIVSHALIEALLNKRRQGYF